MPAKRLSEILSPLIGAIVLLACWHFYVVGFHVPLAVLPKPSQILAPIIKDRDLLLSQGWVTLKECIYGFALAFAIGVPIAVAVATSRVLNQMFYPLLIAMQSVPKVALAPIVLVWLGTGIESKLAIAWLVAFFPIVVDTAAGLRATPAELLELARSLRATRLQIFFKIQFPAALPFVMSGCKVAVTLAVIGAVIGEFVGSSAGLGNLLLVANSQVDTPLAFAALFALAALGILLYGAVALVELALSPWLPSSQHRG
ncbi:MAG TPA: ABC transporter permease [Alphaproteobacteria bacterium]|nr:ABC transporter permease [Alphaproteobacteria bacterium]